jgi:hypothetical protein
MPTTRPGVRDEKTPSCCEKTASKAIVPRQIHAYYLKYTRSSQGVVKKELGVTNGRGSGWSFGLVSRWPGGVKAVG